MPFSKKFRVLFHNSLSDHQAKYDHLKLLWSGAGRVMKSIWGYNESTRARAQLVVLQSEPRSRSCYTGAPGRYIK